MTVGINEGEALMDQITRTGHILSIHDGLASIRVDLPESCKGCGSRAGCGGGKAGGATVQLEVPSEARPGQMVTLSIAEGPLVHRAMLTYLLPALTTLLGTISLADGGDVAAVVGFAVGLLLGLVLLRMFGRGLSRNGEPTSVLASEPGIRLSAKNR